MASDERIWAQVDVDALALANSQFLDGLDLIAKAVKATAEYFPASTNDDVDAALDTLRAQFDAIDDLAGVAAEAIEDVRDAHSLGIPVSSLQDAEL